MKKTVFVKNAGISANTLAKPSHNDMVSMDVIVRICRNLNCTMDDIRDISTETAERWEEVHMYLKSMVLHIFRCFSDLEVNLERWLRKPGQVAQSHPE